jgi:hypothetical protein
MKFKKLREFEVNRLEAKTTKQNMKLIEQVVKNT